MHRAILACALVVPLAACHSTLGLGAPPKHPPLIGGATCFQSSECGSGLCLAQHCCNLAICGADLACQATSCDPSGACQYPTGSCRLPFCDTSTSLFTQSSCVSGVCSAGTPAPCPGSLICASEGACLTQCATSSDCLGLNLCDAGTCVSALANGSACLTNGACFDGICGASGTGHCCATACASSDTLGCAATDCDATGACVYPGVATPCVALACAGHLLTEPAFCDGVGACSIPSPAWVDCSPYECSSATQCGTTCATDSACIPLGFCNVAGGNCCAGYPGGILEVDGTTGVDQPCCGSGPGPAACATIAYSVQLAGKSPLAHLTIHVANPPSGSEWIADVFPIQLSYGVTLSAPGLYFAASSELPCVFDIAPFGSETSTSAVIQGNAMAPVQVGLHSAHSGSAAQNSIQVDAPMTLYLLNARVANFYPILASSWGDEYRAILVNGGATLTLGTDGQGASGGVDVGDPDFDNRGGEVGILCLGTDAQHLAVINDTGSTASPSIWVRNEIYSLEAMDFCRVTLSAHPRFGSPMNPQGTCAAGRGIAPGGPSASGSGQLALSNAVVECLPRGLFATNGGVLDLGGGGNVITCNDLGVLILDPGIAVNLEKVSWNRWDQVAGHTEIWTCDTQLASCTCSGASTCPSGSQALPNGADIVITDPTTTADDANGRAAPNGCP
jgi:hypothetical protein